MTEDIGPLVDNWMAVEGLQRTVSAAPMQMRTFCSGLSIVIRQRAWVRFYNPHAKALVEYEPTRDGFIQFVTTKFPNGLGSTIDQLRQLLADFPNERALMEELLARGPGGANNPYGCKGAPEPEDTINHYAVMVDSGQGEAASPAEQGNSVGYAVRRLSRERPDLLDKVKAGELSCNAAMIEAGFRRVPTTLELLRKAWSKATPQEKDQFMAEVAVAGWSEAQ